MQAETKAFGGGVTDTTIHPVVVITTILVIILMLLLRRKYVIVPFLLATMLTPAGETLVIGGLHFYVVRILILVGWIRMASMKMSSQTEAVEKGFNSLDKYFMVWAVFRAAATLMVFSFQSTAIINQLGFLLDVVGGYFLIRFCVQDEEDIRRVVRTFAYIAAIVAVCVLCEKVFNRNLFGYIGGRLIPEMRDGAIRPQGPFAHPLLVGSFGATLLPLFIWLWKTGRSKVLAFFAILSATTIALAAASSTPLLAYAGGILAICFWPLRKKMRVIRWGLAIGLITLHIVMKAPVWFLITHIDLIGASSGYHRAELIDQTVKHFGNWWLIGTNEGGNWGWDMWDLSNEFVAQAQTGGLVALSCFIAMISVCFGWIGRARKIVEGDLAKEWFLWLSGAALFSHVVGFFGNSYFDQTRFSWFALLAVIVAGTTPILVPKESKESQTYPSTVGGFVRQSPYVNRPEGGWQRNSPLLPRGTSR